MRNLHLVLRIYLEITVKLIKSKFTVRRFTIPLLYQLSYVGDSVLSIFYLALTYHALFTSVHSFSRHLRKLLGESRVFGLADRSFRCDFVVIAEM